MVSDMTVYVDALLFLNFAFDFMLLLTTSIILKRNAKMFNIILGAFIGSLSILVLFFSINTYELFIIKLYLSIIMNLATFYYKNIKYTITNIVTFYIVSIFLGGFLYFLNIEFSYKHEGVIFYQNSLSINVIILLVISPFILYLYTKNMKMFQKKIKNIYKVKLIVDKEVIDTTGYLDTGNNLVYNKKPVVLINGPNKFSGKKIYVPCITVHGTGVIECVNAKVVVGNKSYKVLLGFTTAQFTDAVLLLNNKMEGIS